MVDCCEFQATRAAVSKGDEVERRRRQVREVPVILTVLVTFENTGAGHGGTRL